jgi:type II secretory pathway component PulF
MELVELQQSAQEVRRVIADAFWYPTVVLVLALAVLLFIVGFVAQAFGEMMREFQLSLPVMTRLVLWWGDTGIWLFGVAVLLVIVLAASFRIMAESAGWHRLLGTMPLFGAVWQASGIAQWMGLLRVLLKYGMTLPEALRLAGHGASNSAVADCSRRLADGVVRGRLLSQMMLTQPALPATLIPLVQWGEQSGALGESFQLGQQMFEERARIRAAMIQAVLPPLLFIFIGCMVIFVVIALFMPMVDLISKLS